MDLHEIIFSRGDVQGLPPEALEWIMDRHNCGLVHQTVCHKMGEGGEGRQRAIQYLIMQEGYVDIKNWIEESVRMFPDLISLHPMEDLDEAYRILMAWAWRSKESAEWRKRIFTNTLHE